MDNPMNKGKLQVSHKVKSQTNLSLQLKDSNKDNSQVFKGKIQMDLMDKLKDNLRDHNKDRFKDHNLIKHRVKYLLMGNNKE
jgi:hypothetical protein